MSIYGIILKYCHFSDQQNTFVDQQMLQVKVEKEDCGYAQHVPYVPGAAENPTNGSTENHRDFNQVCEWI